MIHHHGCCYYRRLSLYSIIFPFLFYLFFFIFLFLSSFFLIYPYELTSDFHPPQRGKTYFSAFLVQICYVCQCRALLIIYSPPHHLYAPSSSSGAPRATPPQGAVIMHPSLLVDKDKKPLFLYTLFNSNLSNLRNSIRFAFFPISPVILLLVSLFDAPQSSFTP